MDGTASPGSVPPALGAEGTANLALLKKSQDLMASQAASLLATLPEARPLPPSPPGVGGKLDLFA